jgi:class 3 adenylate cyclase
LPDVHPGSFPHLWGLPHGTPHEVSGSLLFADISGFTSLSEHLAQQGTRGTETLTHLLNRYFQTMLSLVQECGGQILGFGGDAFLAGFYGEPTRTHPWACHGAARLLQAMSSFHAYPTPWGTATVRMKAVVCSGTWGETLLGDSRRRVPFLYGTLLKHLLEAEDRAQP